jgi:hypothetical protein
MPRISEFFGIVIAMYYNDHVPPHFHAKRGTATPGPRHGAGMGFGAPGRASGELGSGEGREAVVQDTGTGMRRAEMMRVAHVEPLEGYHLRVRFASGEERDVDVERYLRGPVFEPIRKDRALFEAVSVDEELGVVVWPNGADIDSTVLYGAREPAWVEEEARSPGMVRERRPGES